MRRYPFPVFILDEDFHSQNSSGKEIRKLSEAIIAEGFDVDSFTNFGDLTKYAPQHSKSSAFILSLNDGDFRESSDQSVSVNIDYVEKFIIIVRGINPLIPIYLLGENKTSENLPNSILRELHGFIHLYEDTPEFVSRRIRRDVELYMESLVPPFFRALSNYTRDGLYSWHCPGHSGGVAFLKSPIGRLFHDFFGETLFRSDVCNSVDDLGQLLKHSGPILESENNVARIFGADHCFFVTNGTSTSNKIVWTAFAAAGEPVLVDRNCHKSTLHAIILSGSIPIFLRPVRNELGMIGPIPLEEFDPENIRRKISAHPLADRLKGKYPRIMILTQSTYDGIIYQTGMIRETLKDTVEILHFDEAWLPHASFHPFYDGMYAMAGDREEKAMIFSTQSTHKLLAGISQASQILVKDGNKKPLDRHTFNEAYLFHTSTSPNYSIIASCDVAGAMMEQPAGRALVDESLRESIDFRRVMAKIHNETKDWWFSIWGPAEAISRKNPLQEQWMLNSEDNWHGFGDIDHNLNMLDPIRATIITSNLGTDESAQPVNIPALIVSRYLVEDGIVVEKTGYYSFLVMFTIGITKGRWNSLVTALEQFKDDYDANAPLEKAMPKFISKHSNYRGIGLADLCHSIQREYAQVGIVNLSNQAYLKIPEIELLPCEAHQKSIRGNHSRVRLAESLGKVSSHMITPYPPGIPLIIPGEKLNQEIIDFFSFAADFNLKFPGFDTDIHGITTDENGEFLVDIIA